MQSGFCGTFRGRAGIFKYGFHQINTPPRAVPLVTEQLVRGAGGITESTVHTTAKNAINFLETGIVQILLAE